MLDGEGQVCCTGFPHNTAPGLSNSVRWKGEDGPQVQPSTHGTRLISAATSQPPRLSELDSQRSFVSCVQMS